MKDPNVLRQRAKTLADEAEAIMTAAGDADLTDEQRTQFDEKLAASDNLVAEAKQIEGLQARQAAFAAPAGRQTTPQQEPEQRDEERVEVMHAARARLSEAWGPTEEARGLNAYRSGQFLRAHLFGHEEAQRYCNEHGIAYRSMSTGTAGAGGVLVPDEFESTLIALMNTYGDAMQECRVVPIGGGTTYIPRRVSGTTTYIVGDNTEITASDAAFDNISLTPKKFANLTKISNELVSDGVLDIAAFIAAEQALSLSTKLDACVIDGDGTSTYGGIHGVRTKMVDGNHAASYTDATAGDDQWPEYLLADLVALTATLPNWAFKRGNVKWHVSRPAWHGAFQRLQAAAGGNSWGDIGQGGGPIFLGYPVKIWDAMPTATTALNELVAFIFGNFQDAVTIGVNKGGTVMQSAERYFEYDQLGVRTIMRIDANVHDIGDASTAGALVGMRGNTS